MSVRRFDILLSLKGEDSYGAGCWSGFFGGFLPQPPYFSGGQRRGLTFGLSTHRSFGREDDRTNQREKKAARVTFLDGLTRQPYIPGLNAGLYGPKRGKLEHHDRRPAEIRAASNQQPSAGQRTGQGKGIRRRSDFVHFNSAPLAYRAGTLSFRGCPHLPDSEATSSK